jgi:hypothetical protein
MRISPPFSAESPSRVRQSGALSNFEWVAAIAVNPAAHQHAAVLGRVKGKPHFVRCFAPLTHPARGGWNFVHGRDERMVPAEQKNPQAGQ